MFKNIDRFLLLLVGLLLVWAFVDPDSCSLFWDGVGSSLSKYIGKDDAVYAVASAAAAFPFAIGIFVIGLAFALFLRETGWLGVALLTAILVTILLSDLDYLCKVSGVVTYLIDIPILLRSGAKLDRSIQELRNG